MKYLKYLFIIIILVIPFITHAENICDNNIIQVQEISLNRINGNTLELSEPIVDQNEIKIDTKMYDVGDSISYNIKLKNIGNKDFVLENNIINSNDFIKYTIEPKDDNSYKIKKDEEKEYILKAMYSSEVLDADFLSGSYNASSSPIIIVRDDTFVNPQTGTTIILAFFVILFILLTYIPIKNMKIKNSFYILILCACSIIPLYTNADCTTNLGLNSSIVIGYVTPNPCTYNGDLVQGAEYINGQYTYRYMQEVRSYTEWYNIDKDGWGVQLTDKNSTDPVTSTLCTSINDKPIVSLNYMFHASKSTSVDLSSYDTSNVYSMMGMFHFSMFEELNLSQFDTRNVENFSTMFSNSSNLAYVDLSGFDFTKTYNLYTDVMFSNCNALKTLILNKIVFTTSPHINSLPTVETIIMNDVDATRANYLSYMFSGDYSLKNLEMSNWDVSNVVSIERMFINCRSLESVDLSEFNFESLQNLDYIFSDCTMLEEINLSNVVGKQTKYFNSITCNCTSIKKMILDNWEFSYAEHEMWDYTGVTIPYVSAKNWVIPESFYRFGSENDLYLVETIDVSNWDLSSTTNLSRVFYEGYKLKNIIGLDTWDTSNVQDMSYMFYEDYVIEEIDISNFDFSSATTVSNMFNNCRAAKKIIIGDINAPNLESLDHMFSSNGTLEEIIIGQIDAPITNVQYMFSWLNSLTTIDLSGLDTTNISTIQYMFSSTNNIQTVYVKSQADADILSNTITGIPSGAQLVVKTV